MAMNCPLCASGVIGREWSKRIILGRVSPQACAEHFGITVTEVYEHINTHEMQFDEETGDCDSPDFYMGKLLKMIRMMEAWIKFTVESEEFDPARLKIATTLMREIRETLKTLAEFQGMRESGNNMTVQITQIKTQYMQLTNAIMEEACDECRGKILNVIDAVPKQISSQ